MTKPYFILVILLTACFADAESESSVDELTRDDPYIPRLTSVVTNSFAREPWTVFRFSEKQLNEMALTKLETNRFVAYIEHRWTIDRLEGYCTKTNVFPRRHQNLVAENCPIKTDLHKGKLHDFDRIFVYVNEDDGHASYVEDAGRKWHRWAYSINIQRGEHFWVIIEQLPNDFMDSDEYVIDEADHALEPSPAESAPRSPETTSSTAQGDPTEDFSYK